jgi:hypothetical protein
MSSAALNVCRRTMLVHQLRIMLGRQLHCRPTVSASAKRTSPQTTISSRSSCPFVASGRRPSPRPRKKRDFDPKNFDHIGRTNDTSHCHSTASTIRLSILAARRKHTNMPTSPCYRVGNLQTVAIRLWPLGPRTRWMSSAQSTSRSMPTTCRPNVATERPQIIPKN